MTPEAALAAGIIFGALIMLVWFWVTADQNEAREHDLEHQVKDLRTQLELVEYDNYRMRMGVRHKGTPYINTAPGVRDGMYSAAYLDDQDAA